MSFLVCMECEVSCSLDNHLKQIRPALCGPLYDGSMKAARWLEPPRDQVITKEPSLDNLWGKLSQAFDEVDTPMRVIVSIPELRSKMWQMFRINKTEFQKILELLWADESPYRNKINASGAPGGAYTKTNFVELRGRHYMYIEVRTPEHEKYMAGHRS